VDVGKRMAGRGCDGDWQRAEASDRERPEAGEGSPTPWLPVRALNGRGERRVVVRRWLRWCVVGRRPVLVAGLAEQKEDGTGER